jgi:hypothetical protein
LAEYRQRKAHADRQKKKQKKKKRETDDNPGGDGPARGEAEQELDQSVGEGNGEEVGRRGELDPPTTEFTFARTLHSGETVKHDQTYTIEVRPKTTGLIELIYCSRLRLVESCTLVL